MTPEEDVGVAVAAGGRRRPLPLHGRVDHGVDAADQRGGGGAVAQLAGQPLDGAATASEAAAVAGRPVPAAEPVARRRPGGGRGSGPGSPWRPVMAMRMVELQVGEAEAADHGHCKDPGWDAFRQRSLRRRPSRPSISRRRIWAAARWSKARPGAKSKQLGKWLKRVLTVRGLADLGIGE